MIMATIWGINGYFQSFGALSIVKINAAWFHLQERGKFAGIFGIMIQSGRFMAYRILPMVLIWVPWKYAFFLPALMLGLLWFVLYSRVEDSPVDAGYPELDPHDESPPYPHLYHYGIARVALTTNDMDGDIARAKAAGAQFISEPAQMPASSGSRARFVCFKDPDGTVLELVENSAFPS